MAIHDWTRVDAGTWHSFHYTWIAEIKRVLNTGGLPDGYYADAERHAPPYVSDVLTLEEASHEITAGDDDADEVGASTTTAVASAPKLSLRRSAFDDADYAARALRITVRHQSGDRLVALLEVTSPGNKDRPSSVAAFADKAAQTLRSGVHLSLIDLFPPRRHDAVGGLVGAVAAAAGFGDLDLPPDKALCLAAYEAGRPSHLYAEPLAVGDDLPNLPLFYRVGRHVEIPLSATYAAAWEATPRRWRQVIEA